MKVLALNSIRYNGHRWKAGQVADLPDLEAARLIAQGWAQEASASAKEEAPAPVKRNTDKMAADAAAESAKRGRR